MAKSSGQRIPRKSRKMPLHDEMRLALKPCNVCGSDWRTIKAFPCGKRKLGTPIRCYMDAKHKLKGKAARLAPRDTSPPKVPHPIVQVLLPAHPYTIAQQKKKSA